MEHHLEEEELVNQDVIQMLEKNVEILKLENRYISRIECDMEDKVERFKNTSCDLACKLRALRIFANSHPIFHEEIKHFAEQISNLWLCMHRQICEKHSNIRMASNTSSGVPLSMILNDIKKEIYLIKLSVAMHKAPPTNKCVGHAYKLFFELEALLSNLEECDKKLQQYLCISKITPQLLKLESAIDIYVSNLPLSPKEIIEPGEINAFTILAKLLTGELLGEEFIDPATVLTENLPKKPVFIIRNMKRKI